MLQTIVALQLFAQGMKDRFEREDGATAVEYGLMVALIAVAIIVAVTAVGTNLTALFNHVADKLKI
jgi:pilus assembly protein Flp/PilA